jgi:hypothetical protein
VGLVGEEHLRPVGHGDRAALLLATRQLRRSAVRAVADAEQVEQLSGPFRPLAPAGLGQQERQGHVLGRGEERQRAAGGLLPHEPHHVAAIGDAIAAGHVEQVVAGHPRGPRSARGRGSIGAHQGLEGDRPTDLGAERPERVGVHRDLERLGPRLRPAALGRPAPLRRVAQGAHGDPGVLVKARNGERGRPGNGGDLRREGWLHGGDLADPAVGRGPRVGVECGAGMQGQVVDSGVGQRVAEAGLGDARSQHRGGYHKGVATTTAVIMAVSRTPR